jgi:hypothetical protein
MIGKTGRAGLPLLCEAEERAGERRCVTENCDRPTSRPSLQLSPRSFLVGRECQIKPVHGLGNLTNLRAHSTDYQTKLVSGVRLKEEESAIVLQPFADEEFLRSADSARNVARRVGSRGAAPVKPSGLYPGRFPAQVFLPGGVNANYFAVGDEHRNHDLEARFELRLLP